MLRTIQSSRTLLGIIHCSVYFLDVIFNSQDLSSFDKVCSPLMCQLHHNGIEPHCPATGLHYQVLRYSLSNVPSLSLWLSILYLLGFRLVSLRRFERPTYCLGGNRSILLSYKDILEQVMGVEPTSSAWKADVLAVVRHLHMDCLLYPQTVRFIWGVPVTGFEPVRCFHRGILSPLCLPIPPHRHV